MDEANPVAALSIAGSDSGGGAGIQMDLRVMHRLGVFATTALTAVTAQNLDGVTAVQGIGPDVVQSQIAAACSGFPIKAIKTGMLWSRAVIEAVIESIAELAIPVVVDPVMVATAGDRLLDLAAVRSYGALLRVCTLATPNLDEAAVLLNRDVDANDLRGEARRLAEQLGCAVLLKGGHLDGDPRDVLASEDRVQTWTHPRVLGVNTHGTGCMLSSAIAARIALGQGVADACADGLAFVHDALQHGKSGTVQNTVNVESASIVRSHLTPG